eukprot:gnl/MRDRNA2_/MRDRNA2_135090_c0_seq1.p1 gnl/MRDRNA2_/MRDRNA2_135090_c0~~gnl/MRDRNA2_/MRDRNA2_135090_c0_seq1.p1  ORF type:complete len:325 (-),score=54.37 gnl/MRDRNA2_/MRDRNA2_135090_c0_seq1:32-1006(-)
MGSARIAFLAVAVASELNRAWSRQLFFTASGSGSSVHSLDLSTTPATHHVLLEYPFGSSNPGGGATGICSMNGFLYWADQTTATVHSVELANGKAVNHNTAYIPQLTNPQGVWCDTSMGRVYVVDNQGGFGSTGTPTILYREHDGAAKKMNITNRDKISSLRSIISIKGDLWVAGDGGIFRAAIESDSVAFESVTEGGSTIYEGIAADQASKTPRLFSTSYDWGGEGVLSSALKPDFSGMQAPLWPLAGSQCQRGSETLWSLAVDDKAKKLYWVLTSDQTTTSIMVEQYEESNQKAQVVFHAKGLSGYGLTLDSIATEAQSVLV